MKKVAYTLIIVGLAVQALDVLTYKQEKGGGIVFGEGGLLAGVDRAVPKATLFGVPTNIAFWPIAVGTAILVYEWVK
jgi:hypothetical protein